MFRMPLLILVVGALYVLAADVELFPDTYDHINITEILANDRLRDQYYTCFMALGPCKTADAKFFKELLPETIATQCRRCTERQKVMLEELTVWYTKNQPDNWNKFIAKSLEDAKKLKIIKGY